MKFQTLMMKSAASVTLALVIVGSSNIVPAFAATINNDPQDRQTLRVMNRTVYGDTNSQWSTSASASAGDIMSFAIYYHVTSTDAASDLRVRLSPQITSVGTNHVFSAQVWAQNASQVSGSASISLSSSQKISFTPGTVLWRPDQTVSGSTPLPFGQTGAEVFTNDGLRLGDIQPGWPTQGSVVLSYQVSNVQPPTVDINASPMTIVSGQSSTLSWTSTNASSCTASNAWSGTVSSSGSQTVSPTNTSTYTMTCQNSLGQTASDSTTVTVTQPAPTADIKANGSDGPITVAYNAQANISWTSLNASTCSVSPGSWAGTSGTQTTPMLTSTQVYMLSCNGAGGSVNDSVTVNVQSPLPPTVVLNASPTSITSGQSSVLSWSSSNAVSCSATGGWSGAEPLSGSQTVSPTMTTTYYITCQNVAGQTATDSKTVTVVRPTPTADIKANGLDGPISIGYNSPATISWTSTNANQCSVSATSQTGTTGSFSTGNLTYSQTYTISCWSSEGTAYDSVTVNVQAQALPTVDLTANPLTINQGQFSTLSWTSANATSCNASGGWSGTQSLSGSLSVNPTITTTYSITCANSAGQAADSVTVNVNQGHPVDPNPSPVNPLPVYSI